MMPQNLNKPRSMATDRKTEALVKKRTTNSLMPYLIVIIVASLILVIMVIMMLVSKQGYFPAKIEPVTIHSRQYSGQLTNINTLSLMTYNVKFMESNQSDFIFYGDNNATWSSKDGVITTINNIAKLIEDNHPAVILLQEVDIASKRSYYINQIQALLNKISGEYQYWACTPYWKSKVIPGEDLLSNVHMDLCTISKFPITTANRYALPNGENVSWFTKQFIPKRAVLKTTLKINNKEWDIYNLHLSPNSKATKVDNPELNVITDLTDKATNSLFIVGGDFNRLADKKFAQYLPVAERGTLAPTDQNFKNFFTKYQSIPTLTDLNGTNFKTYFTFMGTGAADNIPDRTVDYFFLPKNLKVIDYKIINNDLSLILSDHLPLIVTVEL